MHTVKKEKNISELNIEKNQITDYVYSQYTF